MRITRTLVASAVILIAASAGVLSMVTPAAASGTNQCPKVSGTTGGVVTIECHGVANGMVAGSVFVGSSTGTVNWTHGKHSYTTTISITTTEGQNGNRGFCAQHRLGLLYDVTGTVTANTEPHFGVGDQVVGFLCISSTGSVRQMNYSGLAF